MAKYVESIHKCISFDTEILVLGTYLRKTAAFIKDNNVGIHCFHEEIFMWFSIFSFVKNT
jgi:hypothetical protein